MSETPRHSGRVRFTGPIGDARLDRVFADAEKWVDAWYDEQNEVVASSLFIRHPRYPKCTGYMEYRPALFRGLPPDPYGRHWPKRQITDDGRTPVKGIAEVARYLTLGRDFLEKRRGGPEATPEEDRLRIVRGWEDQKGRMLQEVYAATYGIDATTLRRWRRELKNEGKLD